MISIIISTWIALSPVFFVSDCNEINGKEMEDLDNLDLTHSSFYLLVMHSHTLIPSSFMFCFRRRVWCLAQYFYFQKKKAHEEIKN